MKTLAFLFVLASLFHFLPIVISGQAVVAFLALVSVGVKIGACLGIKTAKELCQLIHI